MVYCQEQDPYLKEAKHHSQDVLGVWTKVFICWDAVDDFQHQLSQLLKKLTILKQRKKPHIHL